MAQQVRGQEPREDAILEPAEERPAGSREGHDHCDGDGCSCGRDHGDHGHCCEDGCSCDRDRCDDDGCSCVHDHCDDDGCSCGHDHGHISDRELAEEPSFSYQVLGIDCPSCAQGTQNAVRTLPTVKDAHLIYATATLEVIAKGDASLDACKREVLACVRSRGQDLDLTDAERVALEADRPWYVERREQILMGISGGALAVGLVLELALRHLDWAIPLYVCAALAGLVFVAPMALASLRRRTADMNVLMGIAVIGGLILGFLGDQEVFRDAAIVIFLDQVGEWLEGWSMRKTSGSIKELMELTPDVVHLIDNFGHISDIEVAAVEEGQFLRILPGERVPLDGVIVRGTSSFNEAPVTGESLPKDKGEGDQVFAGALNTSSVIDIEVTADEDCTTLARIISLVQGAQAEKAPYESFVDRFAAAYTPVVIVGAVIVGLVVPLAISLFRGFGADTWHDWVYRALSLLVVACPCALVISTPVSFVSALTRAAKNGVLVKGGAYFDIATKVDAIAFDKTGTLTTGRPAVTEVASFNGATDRDVLQIALTLEEASTHPLARAIVEHAEAEGLVSVPAQHIEEIASNGMLATVDGVPYLVGKLSFARQHARVTREAAAAVQRMGSAGATALVVCAGGVVAGVIGVADTIRPATNAAMLDLASLGIDDTLMLTGDNPHAAAAIAREAGVASALAELLPQNKVERLRDLQVLGKTVAMVGDGINDAPALATADLGITMGAAASDTALEVADVALLSDDLAQLPAFFALATKTMHVVQENIAFAIGVKILVFVLVIAGVAGMGGAVFADTGVALIVILNGMRLMLDSSFPW